MGASHTASSEHIIHEKETDIRVLLLNGGNENVSKELGKGNFKMGTVLKHHIAK